MTVAIRWTTQAHTVDSERSWGTLIESAAFSPPVIHMSEGAASLQERGFRAGFHSPYYCLRDLEGLCNRREWER